MKNPFKSKKNISRKEFVKKIEQNHSVLEIGPFYNPVCKGANVNYFDILSQDEMIQRASEIGQNDNINNVPHIDFISKTGDLSIINKTFDAIVSSHVIEHQLDFINHLNMVSNLLKENCKYYLMVPDKRYCFDHFNNLSSIADIINATYQKQEKHTIKSVIEHRALTTHNSARRHWKGDHGDISNNIERIKAAISEYKTGEYIDVHAWYFTPNSFATIIETLERLNMIDLSVDKIYPTKKRTLEFLCNTQKNK